MGFWYLDKISRRVPNVIFSSALHHTRHARLFVATMAATHMNSMLAVSWQLNDVPVGKGLSPGKRKVEDFQPSKSNKKGTVDLLPLPLPLLAPTTT